MKIQEINVAESVTYDNNANEKACANIFFTSTLDFVFLTATYGYALSDWIIGSGASYHVSPHKEWFTLSMWPQKIMYGLGMSRHVRY